MEVGLGEHTHFWKDKWCTLRPLMLETPYIYSMVQNKNVMVMDYWDQESGWNVLVQRYLNDWEIDEMVHLLGILDPIIIDMKRLDERTWVRGENGRFSVRSRNAMVEMGEVSTFD